CCSSIKPTSPRRARNWASTRPRRRRRAANRRRGMQWNKLDHALSRTAGGAGGGDDVTSVSAEPAMLDVLQGFVHELRLAGLPVSMTENLDAMRAVEHVPLEDRDAFKTALGATLVKHHGHHKAFDTVFEVYF